MKKILVYFEVNRYKLFFQASVSANELCRVACQLAHQKVSQRMDYKGF